MEPIELIGGPRDGCFATRSDPITKRIWINSNLGRVNRPGTVLDYWDADKVTATMLNRSLYEYDPESQQYYYVRTQK